MSIVISGGGGGGGGGGATTLNGLSDVNISGVASGQIIAYNNTSGNWENRTGVSGGLTYKGAFNATAGTPSIANALQGDFYVIDTASVGTLYGQNWNIGDHLLINADMGGVIDAAKIDKVDNTDQVTSVNGSTGAVTGLLEAANNLSDLSNVPTARTNLGLGTAATSASSDFLAVANNLSDLGDAATARTNLGLGTAATSASSDFLAAANNLSDVANAGTARTNLGLGTAAVEAVGTGANQIVQLDGSSRLPAVDGSQLTNLPSAPVTSVNGATGAVTGLLEAANNLSDVANAGTARTNLGLGTAATSAASDFLAAANNLSDVANAGTARTNLGLGTAAVEAVGTGANQIVQLDGSSRLPAVDGSQLTNLPSAPVTSVNGATGVVTGLLEASNNLSDVANAGTARTNLGLGTAAVEAVGTGANQVVQLDGSSRLPAVDGSQLTNVLHDVIDDTSPQLGGDLDVQARIITTSTVDQSIGLEPDGTGTVVARGTGAGNTPGTVTLNCEQNTHGVALQSPPHSSGASYTLKLPTGVGTNGQTLTTDGNNPAQLSWTTAAGGTRPVVYNVSADTTIGTDTAISSSELERVYIVDSSAALRTMTLPQITGNVGNGYRLNIKRDGGNNVDITPNANDNIDGQTDGVSISLTVDKAAFTLICDGTNWHII